MERMIEMIIGNKEFVFSKGKSYIIGILNITPDSFSDGGKYTNIDGALRQTERMVLEGADLIDIGGESTRPGYTAISEQEEIERIAPVIERLKKNCDIPISVDTYKWKVAEAAIHAGADMINDIWGLEFYSDTEHKMAKIIAKANVPVCLMHNRVEGLNCENEDVFVDMLMTDMKRKVQLAKENGIKVEHIILDPGVGFAKNLNENKWCIPAIKHLKQLGYPILLGISNKSMIGMISNLPVDQRKEGTIALNVLGRQYGCDFFRVHDVRSNKRALDVADAILYKE